MTQSPVDLPSPADGPPPPDCDVLVVGGGPVGLLLACLLGERGIRTVIVEKRRELPKESMAIGITPPSLAILQKIGLDEVFARAGVRVTEASVHENGEPLGQLHFNELPGDHRYWLSIPQSRTVELLWRRLAAYPSVTWCSGVELAGLEAQDHQVAAHLRQVDTGVAVRLTARFVAGCDGHRSVVRQAAGLRVREQEYPQRFVMADFADHSGLGAEARLYFSAEASVESFPLPDGMRRWIVLLPRGPVTDDLGCLRDLVRRLTGHDLSRTPAQFVSRFGARRMEVNRYGQGRIAVCGDAAHTMSSIGGQGMNTGFADAELLALALEQSLRDPQVTEAWLAHYDRIRRRAFRVAAARAARGMWLGTHRGWLFSHIRRHLIRDLVFAPFMRPRLAPYFAMLTIPFNNLAVTPLPPL